MASAGHTAGTWPVLSYNWVALLNTGTVDLEVHLTSFSIRGWTSCPHCLSGLLPGHAFNARPCRPRHEGNVVFAPSCSVLTTVHCPEFWGLPGTLRPVELLLSIRGCKQWKKHTSPGGPVCRKTPSFHPFFLHFFVNTKQFIGFLVP